jgi:hypothetical protein
MTNWINPDELNRQRQQFVDEQARQMQLPFDIYRANINKLDFGVRKTLSDVGDNYVERKQYELRTFGKCCFGQGRNMQYINIPNAYEEALKLYFANYSFAYSWVMIIPSIKRAIIKACLVLYGSGYINECNPVFLVEKGLRDCDMTFMIDIEANDPIGKFQEEIKRAIVEGRLGRFYQRGGFLGMGSTWYMDTGNGQISLT